MAAGGASFHNPSTILPQPFHNPSTILPQFFHNRRGPTTQLVQVVLSPPILQNNKLQVGPTHWLVLPPGWSCPLAGPTHSLVLPISWSQSLAGPTCWLVLPLAVPARRLVLPGGWTSHCRVLSPTQPNQRGCSGGHSTCAIHLRSQ